MRPRMFLLIGALLVLSLLAAGPHELLHDHGAAPDCQFCALTAIEVADAPQVARAVLRTPLLEAQIAGLLPDPAWTPSSPRAPPMDR